jgi:hypothetical protein
MMAGTGAMVSSATGAAQLRWLLLLTAVAAAELQEPEWISKADRALLCGKASQRQPIPVPFARRKETVAALRWLHVPKTRTSFGNTVYHHACPSIPAGASFAGVGPPYEINFVKKYVVCLLPPR